MATMTGSRVRMPNAMVGTIPILEKQKTATESHSMNRADTPLR